MMLRSCRPLLLALSALAALACLPAWAQHRVHYTLLATPPRSLPQKLVFVPADVRVREISAGGVLELVPQWTQQAADNLAQGVRAIAGARKDFQLVPMPEVDEQEKFLLEQYLATYLVVGSAAHYLTLFRDEAWEHKRTRFDYTLGGGLAFLKEKTGAEAAVVIVGDDIVSSSERKAAAVFAAMLGVAVPMGRSLVSVGIVDLDSGDLLWMHHSTSGTYDLKDADSAMKMLEEIFAAYPGLPSKN